MINYCHYKLIILFIYGSFSFSLSPLCPPPQTLLETTTSLLNHDLHWSLAHLRASVTRGLVPRQDTCNI